jgi:1-aminocyclopropane-1-carboxylate deaminase/D-cysteine desulfhydrase-like pyridoxal-dependent ACC family enzyme
MLERIRTGIEESSDLVFVHTGGIFGLLAQTGDCLAALQQSD